MSVPMNRGLTPSAVIGVSDSGWPVDSAVQMPPWTMVGTPGRLVIPLRWTLMLLPLSKTPSASLMD